MEDTEQASLAVLHATAPYLRDLLGRLPEAVLTADLDRGWSIKKVLAHLVDVDGDAFSGRIQRMAQEDAPALAPIDPLARLEVSGWESRSVASLLDALAEARSGALAWLPGLNGRQLARTSAHGTAGQITISNLLHYWAYHDIAHLRGIQRMVQSILAHELGNTRDNMDV